MKITIANWCLAQSPAWWRRPGGRWGSEGPGMRSLVLLRCSTGDGTAARSHPQTFRLRSRFCAWIYLPVIASDQICRLMMLSYLEGWIFSSALFIAERSYTLLRLLNIWIAQLTNFSVVCCRFLLGPRIPVPELLKRTSLSFILSWLPILPAFVYLFMT